MRRTKQPRGFRAKGLPDPVQQFDPYPAYLRGLSHSHLNHQRGLKGSTFGPASEGRKLSPAERAAVEQQLRDKGEMR